MAGERAEALSLGSLFMIHS